MISQTIGRGREYLRSDPYRLAAAAVALGAGLAVFLVAHELLPYHSSNHDEGVYLQQADLLLAGQFGLHPGSVVLREAFHPWFFLETERGLYPKYAPVPAAMFALGKLAGGYRIALFAVATANVGLTYVLARAAFDRRTGVLAAVVLAGAPLFVFSSAAFLPYAPTTALNLVFAVAYVRTVRRSDVRYGVLAGLAVGLAFFARPFTAVLFAAPFIGHALWHLAGTWPPDRPVLESTGAVAAMGLVGVGVTLAYNSYVTGAPLRFPYQAFAPLDGPGFGTRRILGHEVVYTPELAVRANARVLWTFATRWFTAGPLGTLAAAVGAAAVVGAVVRDGVDPDRPLGDARLKVLLLAVVPSVVLGNLLFWGNLNVLGDLETAGDGLISLFGPFYHFDLLVVLAALAAHGVLWTASAARAELSGRVTGRTLRVVAVGCLLVALPVVGAAEAGAVGPPAETHAAYAEKYERAYEPFEQRDLSNALVFLPPEYGEWRNHPFQWLRNDPGFDGPTVYATSRHAAADAAVLAAYPDRRYFRFRYHGEWTPHPDDHVIPVLERVRLRETDAVRATTTVAVPEQVTSLSVAVAVGEERRRFAYEGTPPGNLSVGWTVRPAGVGVDHPRLSPRGRASGPLELEGPTRVALTVTLAEPGGGTLTYREEVLVRPTADGVATLWPPASSVCTLVTACGLEGTYVPDRPDTRPGGVAMNTTLRDGNA